MIKAFFEVYKILGRLGIKPKDVIGMGGDVVRMGKSLFNTRVNPKLLQFIEKNGKIPAKILEDLKIHARTLKNTSESQKNLFQANIKDILNAKTPKMPIKSKPPVTSIKQPATSVKDAAEAFKGWKPTVIKGGKDPKFNEGGIAELNAELNQLPEYYLPMATGGRTGFGSGSPRHGNYTVDEIVEFKNMLISNGYSPGEANDHIRYLLRNNLEFNFEIPFAIGGIANHFRKK